MTDVGVSQGYGAGVAGSDGLAVAGREIQLLSDGEPAPVRIDVSCDHTCFLAAAHRSPVREVRVHNASLSEVEDGAELVLTARVESAAGVPFLEPKSVAFPLPAHGLSVQFRQFRPKPNHAALAALEERVEGALVITATVGEREVGRVSERIEFLARNQWMFTPSHFDTLAAFVQPNSAAIDGVVSRARALLAQRTGSGSTEGYQSVRDEPGRVHEMAGALFDALRELDLEYTDPPASFEGFGQKVRTPEDVMRERAATCLDSSVLYASGLARMGLHPFIVLVDHHAFVAYWTDAPRIPDGISNESVEMVRAVFRDAVTSNPNCIVTAASFDVLRAVETTMFTSAHEIEFSDAVKQATAYFTDLQAHLRALINVPASVQEGVQPLAPRIVSEDPDTALTVEQISFDEGRADVGGTDQDDNRRERLQSAVVPPRVSAWLRSLLDLSFRNPLLRLPSRSSTSMRIDLPGGVAAVLEDRLMSSGELAFEPGTSALSAFEADASAPTYAEHIRRSGVVFAPDPQEVQRRLQDLVRRRIDEHPERPAPVLEREAREDLADDLRRELDKAMRSLNRKADDIERQTGSNNLFLTIGEFEWTDGTGKGGRAPLFLIPVRIKGSPRSSWSIVPDETAEVMPNHALVEKLRLDHGLSIPALETPVMDDAGIDVDRLLTDVRSTLASNRVSDAVVHERVSISLLDFASSRLWRDLRDHWETFLQSPVVHHLVHTPSQTYVDPVEDVDPADFQPLCPLPADQSQLESVQHAVAGRTFVLEGPPGTGKSQTITNLLAASIAAGRKVLFVAEKSAALEVVRRRLEQVGLGPLCLELFDKEAKPEHIRRQIREALDLTPPERGEEWESTNARLAADERRLTEYRDSLHATGPSGHSLWSARQELLRLGDGPAFDLPAEFLGWAEDLSTGVVSALLDLPRVVGSETVDADHAWSLCDRHDFANFDLQKLETALRRLDYAAQFMWACSPALVSSFDAVTDPWEYAQAADALAAASHGAQLTPEELAVVDSPEWIAQRDRAIARLDALSSRVAPLLSAFRPNVLTDDLGPVIQAGQAALAAGVLTRSKAERAFQAALGPHVLAPLEMPVADILALLYQVPEIRAEWTAAHQDATTLLGVRLPADWSSLDPTSVEIFRNEAIAAVTRAASQRSPIASLVSADPTAGADPSTLVEALRQAATGWAELLEVLGTTPASAARWTRGRSLGDAWRASVNAWMSDTPRFLELQRWCELLEALAPVLAAGLTGVAEEVLSGSLPVEEAEVRFRRGLARAALAERTLAGRLDRFDGRAHERTVEDFGSNHARHRELMTDRIPAELVSKRPIPKGRRIGKWGELERMLSAQRRKLSIRRLMQDYGQYVGDLTPCFLMSPDSVARFLPPGCIEFDLVVFDEASQIEVPRAIGALGRARATVVVGDTRQMPPSRFGSRSMPDDEVGDGSEVVVEDLESLLEECRESQLPTLTLQCHYRSKDEALIAFSNHHFYEDRLTTFPAPAVSGRTPIAWHRVDGRFRRRGAPLPEGMSASDWPVGTNRIEADVVVAEVLDRIEAWEREHPGDTDGGPSIGVVTSNLQQRDLIRDLLERTGNDRVRKLLDRTDADSLLIQNLENVQGDERDVMIMSIGFSPQFTKQPDGTERRGRLPMNFGPLNQKGGERRLNVAITRARSEVAVFCSFDPEEMDVGPSSPEGIRLLHAYLGAARDGVERAADVVGRVPMPPDRHRAEIAEALRRRGFRVAEDVGLSQFRVDLAIGPPDGPGPARGIRSGRPDHLVAVILDGPRWAEYRTPYDRDLLPRSILDAMGWSSVERIWLPMWLYAPDEVLDRVARAVQTASEEWQRRETERQARIFSAPPPLPPTLEVPVAASLSNLPPVPRSPVASPPEPQSSTVEQATTEDVGPGSVPNVKVVSVTEAAPSGDRGEAPAGSQESDDENDVFGDLPVFGEGLILTPAGVKGDLDRLDEPGLRRHVASIAAELVEQLGPVAVEDVCQLVARRFGLSRVRASRIDAIRKLLPKGSVRSSDLGSYAWPSSLDPDVWTGFRRNGTQTPRRLVDVAPEELRNAMVRCLQIGHHVDRDELFRLVAPVFGSERLTAAVRKRLNAVLASALASGHVVDLGNGTMAVGPMAISPGD